MIESIPRASQWSRNGDLEALLAVINSLLEDVNPAMLAEKVQQVRPIFILGAPRSGTTLLLQVLALSGCFGYPSNFVSRFWSAPYLGALVQQMILDPRYNFRDELGDLAGGVSPISLRSNLGKTQGARSPNEFWYFWRRFFPFETGKQYSAEELNLDACRQFITELRAWQAVEQKPLVLKAIIANWNILPLAQLVPSAIFLYIRRNKADNIMSLLKAREQFYGDRKQWYSFKTPGYERLVALPAEDQVVAQVCLHQMLIEPQLEQLPPEQKLMVDYEDFCQHPERVFQDLALKIPEHKIDTTEKSLQLPELSQTKSMISPAERTRLETSCELFLNEYAHVFGVGHKNKSSL